jgi:hypothetical protein
MAKIRILFADDQIPDDKIPDDKIESILKEQHPDWPTSFIAAFLVMRKAVKTLRDSGYDVIVATKHRQAMELAKKGGYNMAIIDLGWYADDELSESQQPYSGWDISEVLELSDKETGRRTPQIIYSNRFAEDSAISIKAADERKLPLYKIYSEEGHQALRATVRFIEANVSTDPFLESMRNSLLQCLIEPLNQQRKWFNLTILFVGLSFVLLLIGLVTAIYGNTNIGIMTSVSSIITAAISSLLYKQLDNTEKILEQNRDVLINLSKEREVHSSSIH